MKQRHSKTAILSKWIEALWTVMGLFICADTLTPRDIVDVA